MNLTPSFSAPFAINFLPPWVTGAATLLIGIKSTALNVQSIPPTKLAIPTSPESSSCCSRSSVCASVSAPVTKCAALTQKLSLYSSFILTSLSLASYSIVPAKALPNALAPPKVIVLPTAPIVALNPAPIPPAISPLAK